MKPFSGNFTQQEPLDDTVIAAATEVLRSGRLHRYNSEPGQLSNASQLEQAFAAYQGARYCLACASGGYAMAIALRAAGLAQGERVLTNAFTLAPVPGAITAAGGKPLLIETTEDLVIDLDDLDEKAKTSGARFLLQSNMRGHLVDMERLAAIVEKYDLILIEDCAHTMGAAWNSRKSGNFGLAGCFSTQTYKHLNSGEGGLLTSDDPDFMARAIILSGSYMLYERHGAAPQAERYVGSSIQFRLPGISPDLARAFVSANKALGVELKWFGATAPVGFTSNHHSWRYVDPQELPHTDRILSCLFDMRLPLTFSVEDCRHIGAIIAHCTAELGAEV